jgi:hypothetical protein
MMQETGNRKLSGKRETVPDCWPWPVPVSRFPDSFRFPVSCALLVLVLGFVGCAPKSVDDYHTGENEEEIVRLLNQREYGKVIWLVESRDGKEPSNKQTAFLLGQAYLGKAGLEPLELAARVGDAQDFSGADAKDIFPSCASGPLSSMKDTDAACLVKRVYFHVPDPDVYEMARARALFRYAYPDAAAAPEWANVLIGALETACVVKRIGGIYLLAKHVVKDGQNPTDDQLRWFARQLRAVLDETDQALTRADHTGNKITQLLTGKSGAVWFDKARGAVKWADNMGVAKTYDLLRSYVVDPDGEAQYGQMLDKIRGYLDEEDKRIAHVN